MGIIEIFQISLPVSWIVYLFTTRWPTSFALVMRKKSMKPINKSKEFCVPYIYVLEYLLYCKRNVWWSPSRKNVNGP